MEKMYLSNNRLVGTIPDNLQGMQKLDEVDFSNNMLSGSVPLR
jgi:Leucine-rich repeat (LRR) protein|tara:strand:- start:296 stop:424 length:129 start_codon:yes stop_codon:yes gene_type:complete